MFKSKTEKCIKKLQLKLKIMKKKLDFYFINYFGVFILLKYRNLSGMCYLIIIQQINVFFVNFNLLEFNFAIRQPFFYFLLLLFCRNHFLQINTKSQIKTTEFYFLHHIQYYQQLYINLEYFLSVCRFCFFHLSQKCIFYLQRNRLY